MIGPQDIVNSETVAELLKASRKATAEDLALVDAMQSLVTSAPWQTYCRVVLEKRIQEFGEFLLQPSQTFDGCVRSEFLKGALYAFCLTRDLPGIILASKRDIRPSGDEHAS